jgi:hypothetical protein
MSFFIQIIIVLLGMLLIFVAPQADGFSYENLPAVAMDYKVHIDAGKEDCYFQYVNPGATFYVSFQVLWLSTEWRNMNKLWRTYSCPVEKPEQGRKS